MSRKKSEAPGFLHAFVPSLANIIFVVVFILALASGPQMLSIDSDLGRHLTIGNYILDNRIVPTRDLFSHTLLNQPRPPYEWLSQIVFALVYRFLRLDGVILLTGVILAIAFTLVYRFANRRSQSPIIAFAITFLAIGASSIHWLPRPHISTFLLLAIWVEQLEQLRRAKPVRLLTFPLIMLFWANLHGGFVFGILAWLAYFAGWIWDKWQKKADDQTGLKFLLVGLASLIASVITPDLWHSWEAVLNNRSSFILSRTVETMPPDLTTSPVLPFTLLLALTVILFLINYTVVSASHFFLLTGLGIMSLVMARTIPLFAIACTPVASELTKAIFIRLKGWSQIEQRFSGFGRQSTWHIIPLALTLLAITIFTNQYVKSEQTIFQYNPQVFPVETMNWLETHPQSGKMFNEFNWGGYILYRTWPQQQVFLDSQSDFYGESLMREYDQIASAQGNWLDLLDKYDVDWAIIPTQWALTKELSKQGWKIAYQDQTTIILVRQ